MSSWSRFCLITVVSALLAGPAPTVTATDGSQTQPGRDALRQAATLRTLPDGLYLVLREADSRGSVKPAAKTEHVLLYDYHFLEPAERGKPSYLTVSTESFIPFTFASAPTKETDSRGRPKLLLQLAQSQVAPLAEFTRKNCGKSVAIVIAGQVVTEHKIREPITGGRMQITRCTDNGCEVLYTQLHGK